MVSERGGSLGRAAIGAVMLLFAGAACATSVALAESGDPAPPIEEGFVTAINDLRTAEGIGVLSVNDGLVVAAREWAAEMVAEEKLAHASDITSGVPLGWTKAGENVGRGIAVDELMDAFMESPGHRRNVLDPEFNQIGVGSYVSDDGVLYTAHRFAQAPVLSPAVPMLGALLTADCPGGVGRVVATVANDGDTSSEVSVTIGSSAEQTASVAPGATHEFQASFQPEGIIDVIGSVAGEMFFAEATDVTCG